MEMWRITPGGKRSKFPIARKGMASRPFRKNDGIAVQFRNSDGEVYEITGTDYEWGRMVSDIMSKRLVPTT